MRQQIIYIFAAIFCIPFLPVLYLIGWKVKAGIPDFPEAGGSLNGIYQGSTGNIKSLLCLGESSVAGVGIKNHIDGFTGQIAKNLAELTGHSVEWSVIAKSGYTAKKVNHLLVPEIPSASIDFIVIGLGGNDTFQLNSPWHWYRNMTNLIGNIRLIQPSSFILIANMPPVRSFPAFPSILQTLFGGLIKLHGAIAKKIPINFDNVHYLEQEISLENWIQEMPTAIPLSALFSDGVHPSELTYSIWGKEIATAIASWKPDQAESN